MIEGKYQAYPEYRPSELEWLNQVPQHWFNVPIKYMALSKESLFLDGDWIESKDISGDEIRYITTGNVGEGIYKEQGLGFITQDKFEQLNCTEVFEGDILISRLNAPIGRSCLVPDLKSRIVTSVDNVIFRVDEKFNEQFVVYLFSSKDYFQHTANLARGATMQRISRGLLGNIRIVSPPLIEQKAIANFLDHETAKIDTLIEKQQQLIKLLKEKRQAVISHAVTKGLNPDVPMRDSGVEWLGEVPEHWVVGNLAYALSAIGDVDHYMPKSVDKGIPYVMTGDLEELASNINFDACKQVSRNDYVKLSTKIKSSKGDVIMARYATIGTASYIDIDTEFLVSYSCVTIKPDLTKVVGLYLFYYFKSDAFLQGIQNQVNTNTQGNVGVNDLKKVKVALPSLSEQGKIIQSLQSRLTKLNKISEQSAAAIVLMQERRTALISAAVTGKIDVRNWSVPDAHES